MNSTPLRCIVLHSLSTDCTRAADKARMLLPCYRYISARVDALLLTDTRAGAGCIPLAGQGRRDNPGALSEVHTAGFYASRFALASPYPTCVHLSGCCIKRQCPGAAQGTQPGCEVVRYNSCLHLPSSTTFLPLFSLVWLCDSIVHTKLFGFYGQKALKCHYLPP